MTQLASLNTQVSAAVSTSRDSKVELNQFIEQAMSADNVVFSRKQAQEIKQFKRGILSVWWGVEAQGFPQSGLQPTVRGRDCFVDIRAKDEETAETIFEELKLNLRVFQPRFLQVCGVTAQPLYNDNLETDGVRATIMCRYVS